MEKQSFSLLQNVFKESTLQKKTSFIAYYIRFHSLLPNSQNRVTYKDFTCLYRNVGQLLPLQTLNAQLSFRLSSPCFINWLSVLAIYYC